MTEQLDHTFWKHKKRGSVYKTLGVGLLQSSTIPVIEGIALVAYQGADGKVWFRPKSEFLDGRFEPIDVPSETAIPTGWLMSEHRAES